MTALQIQKAAQKQLWVNQELILEDIKVRLYDIFNDLAFAQGEIRDCLYNHSLNFDHLASLLDRPKLELSGLRRELCRVLG
jgi:hypothetical protein